MLIQLALPAATTLIRYHRTFRKQGSHLGEHRRHQPTQEISRNHEASLQQQWHVEQVTNLKK